MNWFERKFDFNFDTSRADAICHHLRHTPARLQLMVVHLPEEVLNFKPGGKWSIKEHIGHLSVLEPLWRARISDFEEKKETLTPADLSNKATDDAHFNQYAVPALLDRFLKERAATLALLATVNIKDESHTSFHPRLNKPMRLIDHLYFVAEHDDHHYGKIHEMCMEVKD